MNQGEAPSVQDFDVLIAGGGMVGASLALALAPLGWRIGMLDAHPLDAASSPSFDDRATALSWSSRQVFKALGLWPALVAEAGVIEHIHVSEQGRFGRTRLHAADLGEQALGHVVANRVIGHALAEALKRYDNVQVFQARIHGLAGGEGDWASLHTDQGLMRGRLLVAADGARSPIRDSLGIAANHLDYGQQGLVCNLRMTRPHGNWAYERFTQNGPMAFLPLPDSVAKGHAINLVMSIPRQEADAVLSMGEATLGQRILNRMGAHLGPVAEIGTRACYPLVQVTARELHRGRCVLAGNAAASLHPVAGQGFNLALRGVADLAERLSAVAMVDGDPGDGNHLAKHVVARQQDIRQTLALTRGLLQSFDWPCVGPLRSKALFALDRLGPLRRGLAHQAAGKQAGLSSLARGLPIEGDR